MLAERPQRNTRQRRVILEELRRVRSHPTAAELYERVRRQLPNISLGTIYRNLELLSAGGAIQKFSLGGGEARFDGMSDQHNHVRCVRCGRIDDLSAVKGDPVADCPNEANGYHIIGRRLEFIGICPACREQDNQDREL